MNYPTRTFVEIEQEELNQLKQTIIRQKTELDEWKSEPLVKLLKETDYVNVVATKEMNAFEEFMFDDKYVLRFYRGDHGLICTINESMVSELREVESRLRQQQAEIEALKSVVYWLKENRPEVWDDIQKWRKL